MSQISDLLKFQKFQVKKWADQLRKDPERAFIGAADPFSSKVWGKITGKKYEPMVTQLGGSTEKTEYEANDAGINTQSHNNVDSLAKALTAFYGGKFAANKMSAPSTVSSSPGAGGATSGAGGASSAGGSSGGGSIGNSWYDQYQKYNFNSGSPQQQQPNQQGPGLYDQLQQKQWLRALADSLDNHKNDYSFTYKE